MSADTLDARDFEQLAAAGIEAGEARRQLAQLTTPPPPVRLAAACCVADGIERLSGERQAELHALGGDAARAGRLLKFVPASGAATRMFRALEAVRRRHPAATRAGLEALAGGDADARDTLRFVELAPRLALVDAWAANLGLPPAALHRRLDGEPLGALLASLLDTPGYGAATAPKALLPFHRAAEGPRSAFVEQLVEGLPYLADATGRAHYHFTIAPGAGERFAHELAAACPRLAAAGELVVSFSEQSSATDTLALDEAGRPARAADGRLLLRPAGHGALLTNLESTGGDLVLVKNIDNVLPERWHAGVARWKTILVGRLVEQAARRERDDRPLRVVGVVPNRGEPGGGPFWVADATGGRSLQIVESSQVDLADPGQRAIWQASTHFNPVDLVCALRDGTGTPYRLAEFVDPATAFVSRKSEGGRDLTVLERPGLWNGAMAGWETLFVELPGWTFAPVKSVLDLARAEHASEAARGD
jgi:hypothetical protein